MEGPTHPEASTPGGAVPPGMDPAEWRVRVDLAAAFRLVDHFGWSDLLATHLSARLPGPGDVFLINPFGLMFDEITASDLVRVDVEGQVLDDSPYPLNPAGFTIHSAVHMARPEVVCVMHTHTTAGTSVATQEDGLLPLTQHALAVIAHAGRHAYESIAIDLDERARLARDLGDNAVLFLCNHGLLTVGRTVAEAFMWMYRTERACRMQLALQQSDAALVAIPEEVQQTTIERNRIANSPEGHRPIGKYEWPALLRKLDRLDPSYKT